MPKTNFSVDIFDINCKVLAYIISDIVLKNHISRNLVIWVKAYDRLLRKKAFWYLYLRQIVSILAFIGDPNCKSRFFLISNTRNNHKKLLIKHKLQTKTLKQ